MIMVLNRKIPTEEFEQAKQVYRDYIKTVIDVEKDIIAVGGEKKNL